MLLYHRGAERSLFPRSLELTRGLTPCFPDERARAGADSEDPPLPTYRSELLLSPLFT